MFTIAFILAAIFATRDEVPSLTPSELHELMQKGDAVAVDVRGSVAWRYGHITGAIWLPLGTVAKDFGKLPQDKLIVAYCTCKSEETSLEAAMMLANNHGFERVAVLKGGYPAWKTAGLPITDEREKPAAGEGTKVIAERTVHFPEEAPAAVPLSRGGGRLAPPDAVPCDRNQLTSYSGLVTSYKRAKGKTTLVMHTSADTVETLQLVHAGSDDPSRLFLIEAKPFTTDDWRRIERRKGELLPNMSAVAWVCTNGPTLIDWRPGTTFTGAE